MNDVVNKALWGASKDSEQKSRERTVLEKYKKLFVIAVCVLIFVWAMIACWIDIHREDKQQEHREEYDKN